MTTTYKQLCQYFTEQELDNATIITRHVQHDFPHMTYAEIYINLLVQMISERWVPGVSRGIESLTQYCHTLSVA